MESMLATTREEVGQVKSRLSGSREEVLHLTHINTQLQASVIELERRSTREGEEVQQLMQPETGCVSSNCRIGGGNGTNSDLVKHKYTVSHSRL